MANRELRPLSRRTLLTSALAGAATLGLAACGSGGGTTAPASNGSNAKRMFQTASGAVEIPAAPQRVVCTSYQMAAPLLDVGYSPAAVAEIPDLETFISGDVLAKYKALPKIGSWVEINLEQIIAQKPDMILVNGVPGYTDPKMEEYKKIAPSPILMAEKTSDWTKVAIDAADSVGKKAEAEALRKKYTDRAADIKTKYAAALGKTKWSMLYEVSYGEGQWSLLFPDGWIGVVLQDAGVQFGSATAGKTGTGESYSLERLDLIADTDVIVAQADDKGNLVKAMADLGGQPGFQNLKAAKDKHVFPMPNFYTVSYSSALAVLDTLEDILKKLG
nr:iron compound ABC transporter, periplasmic [uncultured bacterium]